ncbi:DUF5133 domain-containing protein [Streptomyces sp. NPDC005263]|uniref:DUF5133 domain-containing protein n=1 Tax=Streptomyces sp. NPDC005263 TaxID=3364711 RepID=UPI00367F5E6B
MLVPDPKVVRKLLTRYASLRIAQAERAQAHRDREAIARELDDVTYTLCVMVGATNIHEAVAKADALLIAAGRTAPDATDADGEEDGLRLAV